jgi:hypothetical protein
MFIEFPNEKNRNGCCVRDYVGSSVGAGLNYLSVTVSFSVGAGLNYELLDDEIFF